VNRGSLWRGKNGAISEKGEGVVGEKSIRRDKARIFSGVKKGA